MVGESSPARAAFLDRDGVLNRRPVEHCYVTAVGELEILDGAPEAVADLHRAGWLPIVVSNQRGIARGLLTWETLLEIEMELRAAVEAAGGEFAGFYYCPHELHEQCACRKPSPGMLIAAAERFGIDLKSSVFFGDSESDMEAGRRAGCEAVWIGARSQAPEARRAMTSLRDAVDDLLAR